MGKKLNTDETSKAQSNIMVHVLNFITIQGQEWMADKLYCKKINTLERKMLD